MHYTLCWLTLFTRVIVGLQFGMAAVNKVFVMTPRVHAEQFFTTAYADTWIPQWMLWVTGYSIPYIELLGGFMLVAGLLRRPVSIVLGFVLLLVTYGHLLKVPLYDIQANIFTRTLLMIPTWVFAVEHDPWCADGLLRLWKTRRT